jgi:hypothetical protein
MAMRDERVREDHNSIRIPPEPELGTDHDDCWPGAGAERRGTPPLVAR